MILNSLYENFFFPPYYSDPIIHRCIPRPVKDVLTQIISNLYGVLNSWDAVEQVLSDLYGTWKEILALSCLAFGMKRGFSF